MSFRAGQITWLGSSAYLAFNDDPHCMLLAILILGAIGHTILWVTLVNRAHGLGIRRQWVDALTAFCCFMFAAMPVVGAVVLFAWTWPEVAADFGLTGAAPPTLLAAVWAYLSVCAILCLWAAIQRWRWARHPERRGAVYSNHTACIDMAREYTGPLTAPGIPRWLGRLPGNEAVSLCVQEKQIAIPRFKAAHDGLRIVHISDMHMSGRITKAYFERVVEEVNRCDADLVAITGDLIEREECLNWVPDTFGRLRAAAGVYFVLGNHDRHVGKERIIAALKDAGLIYIGGTWQALTLGELTVILAGNELPWYAPAADFGNCPGRDDLGLPLRIVLAHTPDHFGWARENDVDLLLAGHNHGGQICLPLVGPIVAPSLYGVRYASGTFRSGDTVLHVSRGTSSLTPLRWNCPPEIAVLNLRPAAERP